MKSRLLALAVTLLGAWSLACAGFDDSPLPPGETVADTATAAGLE